MKMKRMQRGIWVVVLTISAMFLGACNNPPPVVSASGPHPLTPYQNSLVRQIGEAGAQVIQQGEVLQIVMPTDLFFRSLTTQLKRRQLSTINKIAILVKSYIAPYRRPRITVSGYTDTIFARQTRQQLSLQYAKEVAAYLWSRGVPHQRTRIRGYGAKFPVASNRTPRGAASNRRVVIKIN